MLAASSVVAGMSVVDDGALVDERAERLGNAVAIAPAPRPAPRAVPDLLVSDSAWLGMHNYGGVDSVRGFPHELALASCRRRVAPSCGNVNGFVPITALQEIDSRGFGYHTLIMATGYNDSDHNFRSDLGEIMALTRSLGYQRVVWLTLRSNVTYTSPGNAGFGAVFERNNETLREIAASGRYPELFVADWAVYARDHPEWFSPRDGIHLRNHGAFAAGDYISRKIAFLDGRPCPYPLRPGEQVMPYCADPDATGPVADLDGLYPIGEPFPSGTFVLEFEGSSSWPDPPWWDR